MMTDETDKTAGAGRDIRQHRLKSALRENLKRRKVQARERAALSETTADDESGPSDEAAGKSGS
jgi:hypothetical protein